MKPGKVSGANAFLPARTRRKRRRPAGPFPVFFLLIFWMSFLGLYLEAANRSSWTGIERIVAIGDLHGDYENFVKILTSIPPAPIVDQDLHWIAGTTHLVQMGDILDRGTKAKDILNLLMKLEKEAERAGGKVHVLLGNHEELNITGIVFRYPDYLSVDQFISFLPENYRKRKEEVLQKAIIEMRMNRETKTSEKNYINEFWDGLRGDKRAQDEYLSNFNRKYGSWLLKQNAVIKINDTIFVHGGISEEFSLMGIEKINSTLRTELADLGRAAERNEAPMITQPEIAYKGEGPLWYRALAQVPEADMAAEVDKILQNLGAARMVIAHTPTIPTETEMKRFGGKVWIIDTGIASVYWGRLSALIIQNGEPIIWRMTDE